MLGLGEEGWGGGVWGGGIGRGASKEQDNLEVTNLTHRREGVLLPNFNDPEQDGFTPFASRLQTNGACSESPLVN